MGKLIVIEGLDGSGKSTQIEIIKEYLTENGKKFKQIKFYLSIKTLFFKVIYYLGRILIHQI